jgi:hypothetical protein
MNQKAPKGDRRYRVHKSSKFYVAELTVGAGGGTWSFQVSAERVVYPTLGRGEQVIFRTQPYTLQPPEDMKRLIDGHLANGGHVTISGLEVTLSPGTKQPEYTPCDWIDISTAADRERLRQVLSSPD